MQGEQRKIRWVGMLHGAVIIAWMVALWWLAHGAGEEALLARFIRRDLWWMVYVANAIFMSFAASLVVKWPSNPGPGKARSLFQGGILLLPLLFLPLATTSDLSIGAAVKRSLYTSRASVQGYKSREPRAVKAVRKGLDGNMGHAATSVESVPRAVEQQFESPSPDEVEPRREWPAPNSTPAKAPVKHPEPTMFDLVSKPEDFEGMNVTVVGRVHKDKRLQSDSFYCYRMLMICCAADASPAGVVVKWRETPKMKTGTWVRVGGKAGFTEFEGGPYPAITAVKVEKISPPKDRFIVPN